MQLFKYQLIAFFFILNVHFAESQVSAQWRGPQRDGKYQGGALLKTWPENGPPLLLTIRGVGNGYSQPVIYDEKIYVTGVKNDAQDILSAYDMAGKMLWEQVYGKAWERSFPGTRSTPTIEKGRIYLVAGMGIVSCIDAASGNIIWQNDAHSNYKGEFHRWGIAESALLTETAVIYTVGGDETTVIALNKADGSLLWKTKSLGGPRAYASPLLINRSGINIIIAQTAKDLIGIDAGNGEVLWCFDMVYLHGGDRGSGAHNNTPLYKNGEIFVTNGYNRPAVMFSLSEDGRSITVKWKNDVLDVHHGGVVETGGNIYGANWIDNSRGNWTSVRWEDGHTNWETEWHTKGSIVFADGMLYLYEERAGNIALVKPGTQKFEITGAFQMKDGEGAHWAHPSIYNGLLLIRHGNILNIYDIKVR